MPTLSGMLDTPFPRLHATAPDPLPFATSLHIRAFLLEREAGNLLVYAAPTVSVAAPAIEALGGVMHQYLNHWHEAAFGGDGVDAPLAIHMDDRAAAEDSRPVDETFSDRARLDGDFEIIATPGHTPGATAFLWHNGEQRLLFTGDSVYLRNGEWIAAVLEGSSDRAASSRASSCCASSSSTCSCRGRRAASPTPRSPSPRTPAGASTRSWSVCAEARTTELS